MGFDRVAIPYGAYWSTPFARWQGSLQQLHSSRFAARVARDELVERAISPSQFDAGYFGSTIVQFQSFYGASWPLYEAGLTHVTGPSISQVCATGARLLLSAAADIQVGMSSTALVLAADRTSNGPHIYYPAPSGPGGTGAAEDQVVFNFAHDAVGGHSMLQTAENVAKKYSISTSEQHDVVLQRSSQYEAALADGHAFQKRYMRLPFVVPSPSFERQASVLEGDEGVRMSTDDALAKLKPVIAGGTVTYGGQTYPADGNCGLIVTTAEKARDLSRNPSISVRILGFGQGRAELGFMPEAPIAAARNALSMAGRTLDHVRAVKSHNPFAINDVAFSRVTGFPIQRMNNYGCSLIWGHPQGPTGLRSIIELIEELVLVGGGIGLFQGCAAGDSALAVVIEVGDA